MIKVNLVPADILAKAQQKQRILQAAVAGVLALALIAALSMAHWFRLNRLEAKLAKGQADLKKLEVIVAKVEELEKAANAVRTKLSVINDLLKSRPLYPYFMSDFVRSVPSGVRVRTMTTAGGGSGGGALRLAISAEARTNEDIAAWMLKMEGAGKFGSIELGPVSAQEGETRLYSFTVTCVYTPTL